MQIQFENAVIRVQESVILSDINLTVAQGEHWAITGGNGAGKSTLLDVIAGRKVVSGGKFARKGTVEFVANDYSFHRIASAAAQYYQQRFEANGTEATPTLREVLKDRMKPVGTVNEASVHFDEDTVKDDILLETAGLLSLTHLLDEPFVTLSNGETRRMLLARSLMKKPDILLLDSPFTGLDTASRGILHAALRSRAEEGVTILLVVPPAEIPSFITNRLHLGAGTVQFAGEKSLFTEEERHTDPAIEEKRNKWIAEFGDPVFSGYECAFDLRDIHVAYHGKKVLDQLSWKVNKGEKWALTGPNGSGKSTLLSIITADHPQRFANDFDLFDEKRGGKNTSIWDIKKKIGHMSPELHLYFPPETTVYKTIASGFYDATGIYFRKIDEHQAEQVFLTARIMGVDHLLERKLSRLSKGEQRLVLLARALVKNPPLLILDEPCQGLDIANIEHFKALVDAICTNDNRTLIYVSHYPLEIPSCVRYFKELTAPLQE